MKNSTISRFFLFCLMVLIACIFTGCSNMQDKEYDIEIYEISDATRTYLGDTYGGKSGKAKDAYNYALSQIDTVFADKHEKKSIHQVGKILRDFGYPSVSVNEMTTYFERYESYTTWPSEKINSKYYLIYSRH